LLLQDSVEEIIEVSKTFNEKIRKCSDMTLLSCAYAGIGNVLKVQSCDELVMNFFLKNETFAAPFYVYNC